MLDSKVAFGQYKCLNIQKKVIEYYRKCVKYNNIFNSQLSKIMSLKNIQKVEFIGIESI